MSVVNRMLQDIDRRRAAEVSASVAAAAAPHPDVRGVVGSASKPKWLDAPGWLILLIVAILAGAVVWWQQRVPSRTEVLNTASAGAAPMIGPSGSTVESNMPVSEQKPQEVRLPSELPVQTRAARLPAESLKLSMQLSALVADTPTETRRRAPAEATPTNAPLAASTATSVPVVAAPAAAPTISSSPVAPGKTTITNVPVRQVAFDETINIARTLWSEGNRASALTTLRDALAAAESSRNQRATVALARELARLDVADNRAQSALELLKRLENLLGDDADAWSLRGNAEQRLALHADAVQSYLIALRIRPTEGKWMIGAAISLAAVGKLDEAQAWAERARERDAVTPAIASYLQQLGITSRR